MRYGRPNGYAPEIARDSQASEHPAEARRRSAELHILLQRHVMAATRVRAAMAKKLGMSEIEGLAITHIAQHGELEQARLSDFLDLSPGGTAALLQRLEQEDRIIRRAAVADRRVRLISLSPTMARRCTALDASFVDDLEDALARHPGGVDELVGFFEALALATEARADGTDRRPGTSDPPTPFTPAIWG